MLASTFLAEWAMDVGIHIVTILWIVGTGSMQLKRAVSVLNGNAYMTTDSIAFHDFYNLV